MQTGPHVRHLAKGQYKFNLLDFVENVTAEYIWIGGHELDVRSKSKTLNVKQVTDISQIPQWNFDGSSTRQAEGHDSEVYLNPIKFYRDPFRGGNHILVFCETYKPDGTPANTNFRKEATSIIQQCEGQQPLFGFEQEYMLFNTDSFPYWPIGFPDGGFPTPQGQYYCAVGGDISYGRQVMEAHYKVCLYCGLDIYGTNAENLPGQWEYQIGTCSPLEAADQLWVSRYLLIRVAEHFGVGVNFTCKPVKGDWSGSGCHANYSTAATRGENGIEEIRKYCEKLGEYHKELIDVYGPDNDLRLTGQHETSTIDSFNYGVADRWASIRIPRSVERDGHGYLEDRRPASNMDPYVVVASMLDVTILDGNQGTNMRNRYKTFLELIQ